MTGGYAGPTSAPAECAGFPGAPVIIRGLQSAAQYNGCKGVISSGPAENGRWEVAIQVEGGAEPKVLALKPANFQIDAAAIMAQSAATPKPKRDAEMEDAALLWIRGKGLGPRALTVQKRKVRELDEGEVLLHIEKLSFSAGTLGYLMKGYTRTFSAYHNFFPWHPEAGEEQELYRSGTWGFARVQETRHPKVKEGTRIYGFFPMAKYQIELVDRVLPALDGDPSKIDFRRAGVPFEHREWNEYEVLPEETSVEATWLEDCRMCIRYNFVSGFYLDEQLMVDCGMINAVLISCASSKVALALAYCLNMRVDDPDRRMVKMRNIIGITSPEHFDFVVSTGLYTEVFLYDEAVEKLPNKTLVYVDMKCDGELTQRIVGRMGPSLMFTLIVGPSTFQKKVKDQLFEVVSRTKVFNYSEWAFRRMAANEVIKTGRDEKLAWSYKAFIERCRTWYAEKRKYGADAMVDLYAKVHGNLASPSEMYICSLHEAEDDQDFDEIWK